MRRASGITALILILVALLSLVGCSAKPVFIDGEELVFDYDAQTVTHKGNKYKYEFISDGIHIYYPNYERYYVPDPNSASSFSTSYEKIPMTSYELVDAGYSDPYDLAAAIRKDNNTVFNFMNIIYFLLALIFLVTGTIFVKFPEATAKFQNRYRFGWKFRNFDRYSDVFEPSSLAIAVQILFGVFLIICSIVIIIFAVL